MTRALTLTAAYIRRLPGIDAPFAVPTLGSGLTLLYGPNASGKTSVLRAFEAAIWPDDARDERLELTVRYSLRDAEYEVVLDGDRVQVTGDGRPVRAPRLPAPGTRHRYTLALHDLLAATRADDFAHAIARAGVGGLDLGAAADAIGATDRLARPVAKRAEFDRALRALRETQARQASAHEALGRERALVDAVRAATEAAATEAACAVAIALRETEAGLATCTHELATFPTVLDRLREQDVDAARACVARWRQAREAARDAQAAFDAASDAERALGPAPSDVDRTQWTVWQQTLERTRASLSDAQIEQARAVARRDELTATLGQDARRRPADALRALDGAQVAALATVARRLEQAQAAHLAAVAALGDDVEASTPDDATTDAHAAALREDASALRSARRDLARWLTLDAARRAEASDSAERAPRAFVLGAPLLLLLTVVATAWLAWQVTPWAWLLLLAALGCGVWMLLVFRARRRAIDEARERTMSERAAACAQIERDMPLRTRAHIALPAPWTADSVHHALDELVVALVTLERQADAVAARRRVQQQAQRTLLSLREAEAERDAACAIAGVHFDADARAFGWWLGRLQQWQDAQADAIAAEARVHAIVHEVEETLRTVEPMIHAWCPTDPAPITLPERIDHALAALRTLAARHESRARAEDARSRAARDRDRARDAVQAEATWWTRTFVTPGLVQLALPDGDAVLEAAAEQVPLVALQQFDALEAQRPAYERLCARQRDLVREHERLMTQWQGLSADAALLEASRSALEAAREAARDRAAQRDTLTHELGAVRRTLELARASHDVESALVAVSDARDALRDEWRAGVSARLAHLLVQQADAATRDRQRPAVFHRARHWLARITHGRWKLHLDERDAPGFLAEDTRTMRRHTLDTLSAGTRVQLLVAVRMAFVELEEGDDGPQLPLFLDETLGTSDDQRARALIEAVLELVRAGRQVFYGTAQADEVGKWLDAAAERGLTDAVQLVDLGTIRTGTVPLDPAARASRPTHPASVVVERAAVPDPTGHSHESYGRLLQPAPVLAQRTPLGTTPLWYVVTDVLVLHALLTLGITTWGEWQWYTECGGQLHAVERARVEHAWDEARAMAEVLTHWHALAGAGHGRPVDRQALRASGAVSARFLDQVAALAIACEGDASVLLARLEAGAVPGFGAARLTPLRAALTESGHLATGVSYSAAEIRVSLLSRTADDLARVDALLARLAEGAVSMSPLSHDP